MINKNNAALKTIFTAGLIAGTTDIIAAIVNYLLGGGTKPSAIFKFIASGIFGKEAFQPGILMVWMGLLFHFIIALSWTALFYFLYQRIRLVRNNLIVCGILYGIFVWLLMNKLVLPFSNVPMGNFEWKKAIVGILILMFFFGLPIALTIQFMKKRRLLA